MGLVGLILVFVRQGYGLITLIVGRREAVFLTAGPITFF